MPPKRKLRFFEELIPKDARKQRIENIIPVGNRHFPVVYPESNLVCGLCGAGPFTIGSMSKHMNSIGEGCKEAPTKFHIPSSTDESVVKEQFKLKMQNSKTTSQVLKGMGIMFLMSLLSMNVTTSSILGGFAGGILVGILCAPSYKQSYSMRRKNSVEYDPAPRDYRSAMGFGIIPTERGLVPLPLLWSALAIVLVAAGPKFRSIPSMILKGFLFPGSLLLLA